MRFDLDLTPVEIYRVGLAALDRNDELKAEIRNFTAGRRVLARIASAVGDRGTQLFLRRDKASESVPLVAKAGHLEQEVPGIEVHTREVEGRVHFDLYDSVEDVTIESVRIVDAEHVQAAVPLGAVHLDGPVPPADQEVTHQAPDGSRAVTVWDLDGTAKTYRLGDSPGLLPRRRVHPGRPR